ncbi:hypothetical protein NED98_21570 [Sphingomonas sp. MMSM20]|uniref:hypothetical protein n=1 Tax=Sphingomonas lycopersici TaxID=2951807 RepID=UPI0022383D81|nr:hypothetical protein [Sphingomonas lycopersici]MCW6532840.1 hypothetical protein [Sphingomonas lycopersici]
MAATYRLKGLGWFGGVVIVSLGFYLVSLQVAAERKRLEQVNVRIGLAQRDIRALETEFDVRSNLTQLERWNGDTLALASPTAGQFVRDEGQLASINFDRGVPAQVPGQQQGAVRTASLLVPSSPGPVRAAAPAPVIDEAPAVAVAAARPATLMKVSAHSGDAAPRLIPAVVMHGDLADATVAARKAKAKDKPAADRPAPKLAAAVVMHAELASSAPISRKAKAVAMLDKSLLSDTTMGDLASGARAEARRLR